MITIPFYILTSIELYITAKVSFSPTFEERQDIEVTWTGNDYLTLGVF